ncbi:MAG: hypothetical protein ABL931_22565, partial [Usitatibacteraceae bacterium]
MLDVGEAARIANIAVPASMRQLLAAGDAGMASVRELNSGATKEQTRFASAWHELKSITHLPPIVDADKFLCVGKNYRAHLEE